MDFRADRHTLPIPVPLTKAPWLAILEIDLRRTGPLEPSTASSLQAEQNSTPLVSGEGKSLSDRIAAQEWATRDDSSAAQIAYSRYVRHRFTSLGGKPE
jgi:hypothetical protein